MPSEYSLAQIHEALLTGMGWAGYHLYSFRIGRTPYMEIDGDWSDDSVDPASVRLGDLVGPGDRTALESGPLTPTMIGFRPLYSNGTGSNARSAFLAATEERSCCAMRANTVVASHAVSHDLQDDLPQM